MTALHGEDWSVPADAYDEHGALVVDDAAPGASWEPVDLAAVIAGLVAGTLERHAPTVAARDDGACLFYRGKVNGIAGASGSGKTWTALAACAQEVTAGAHVVYVDLEDDAVGVVGRLLDMGSAPDVIGARFHYVHPGEALGLLGAERLRATLDRYRPSLVVIDSTGESMALEGAKPNDDDDTARWFRKLPTAIAAAGPAALVLDHVVKADDGGLWPIGSQRKRAAISGAQYMQTTVRPFDKGTPGAAKLVCAKDRHGNYRPGQRVAELHVEPSGQGVAVELRAPVEDRREGGAWRPTALMERIAQALEAEGDALSFRAIDERVSGKADHKRAALRVLVDEGHVVVTAGARNANMHALVKPYAQRADPGSDLYAGPGHAQTPDDRVSVSVSLGRDTGHTHSTVSGTHSGHTRDTVPPSTPCEVCGDELHPTLTQDGTTVHPFCEVAS